MFFSAAANKLVSEVSRSTLIEAFESGVDAIMRYGRSEPGDRTMVRYSTLRHRLLGVVALRSYFI